VSSIWTYIIGLCQCCLAFDHKKFKGRELKKFADYWALLERFLLVAVLLSMIIFAVIQILLRNLFDSSLFWIDPLNRLLVLWLAILGAMVATRESEHIAIDVLKHYVSGIWLILVSKLASLFSVFICGLMAFHSARFVYDEFVYKTTTFSELPAWPFELIMPFGFLIMTVRFLFGLFTVLPETERT